MSTCRARQLVALVLLAFWLCIGALAFADERPPQPPVGMLVSFSLPGTRQVLCARIAAYYTGPDVQWWLWLVDYDDPRRVYRMPQLSVTPGCPTK